MGFKIGKVFKKVAPFLAAAVALPFGGPAVATAAASAVGASQRGKGNKLKGALSGAAQGAMYAAAAPSVAEYFGAGPQSFMGKVTGMNSGSVRHEQRAWHRGRAWFMGERRSTRINAG